MILAPRHLVSNPWPPLLIAMALLVALGCQTQTEAPAPAAQPAANEALDLSFSDLPASFAVETNQGRELRLRSTDPDRSGEMWVEVGEKSDFGIDLVAVTNSQKAAYEERQEGEYSGARKLMTPAGEAYYARGRYRDGDQTLEETRVLLLHPRENRLVTFYYLYPAADDSGERLPELFAWIGELQTQSAGTSEPASPPG